MPQEYMGLGGSLVVTALGVGVVFLILIILNLMIKGLALVSKGAKGTNNANDAN